MNLSFRRPSDMVLSIVIAIFLAVLLSVSFKAHAADTTATLNWIPPDANTNGSKPPVLSGYNIYQDVSAAAVLAQKATADGGKPVVNGSVLNDPTTTKYVISGLAPGSYFWVITAWYCQTPGSACVESDKSNVATKTIKADPLIPNPPTGVTAK